jgi:hypothetical protein
MLLGRGGLGGMGGFPSLMGGLGMSASLPSLLPFQNGFGANGLSIL